MLLDKGEIDRADFRLGVVESLFDQTAAAGETPGVPVSNHQEYSTLRGSTEAARAYLCLLRDEYPTAIEHAESALAMLPPDADFWHGTANLFLGLAHWWNGNLPGAFRAIESSVLHQNRCRNFFYHAFGMVLLAEIRTVQGRLIEAQEQFDRIIGDSASTDDWNREKRSELIQDPVALYTGLGELHRLRGELDWAERYLSRGTDIRYQAILPATTYRLYTLRARMHESRHNYQNALADLDTAERLFAPGAVPDVFQIGPLKARIWLRLGRHREALEWAENHPIGTTEGPVPYRDIFSRLTWIRVMVEHAMETRDDAGMTTLLSVLDNFVEGLLPVGFTTMTIEALLLQSSILDRHGEVEAAAVSVERAVELSEPESIIQPFLDEGMVLFRPLKHALSRGKQTVFLKTVLTALQGDGSKESPPAAAANHLLIEPLSPRELEVLHLVASGQTNQEIGDSLYISLSTVKKHLNNLYGKMSVKNRTESLHRARELGLI
jgi:LuxR family maltose regulon positive regulatory protein